MTPVQTTTTPPPAHPRRLFLLTGMAAALVAGGCTVINPTAPQLYTLTPAADFPPAAGSPATWQLLVEAPTAAASLDTPRIAVAQTATAIDYFADVSWTDRAPKMIQGLLVESFENSRRIVSVGRDTVGLRSDFVLKAELRDFQAEYTNPGAPAPNQVRVRLSVKLVSMPQRTIAAGEVFDAVVPVDGRAFPTVVNAFDAALRTVMARTVEWTLRTGNSAPRPAVAFP
ncbi:cholesterol transport system auxiliary component [Azospirillum fermentarium]|uniref:ABC-type transport auxiliary lipoprotein family protein n=1 Tax=Azospirillum fermentarium TaxID=1233114 RepID=UPI0022270F00|nr:ABC-type transport auxiliary lipoprotein family protein [Azospirillum fermentarium]MCW2247988.1 cholesterol transport system auxiliary component [Azospirillum fermentarium]